MINIPAYRTSKLTKYQNIYTCNINTRGGLVEKIVHMQQLINEY